MIEEEKEKPKLKSIDVNEHLKISETEHDSFLAIVHIPTGACIKRWAMVLGLEEGAWEASKEYVENIYPISLVNWETDDVDFLFPCTNFQKRFMDPVGFGDMTVEEASAKLINKCRGKKLVGIRKYKEDPYCDHNDEGLILEFSNGHIIHITGECNVYRGNVRIHIEKEE